MSRWFACAIGLALVVFGAALLSGTRVWAEPTPVPVDVPAPSDVNEDGFVTFSDAFAVAAGIGGENADVNADGFVDRRDIAAVLSTMGFEYGLGRDEGAADSAAAGDANRDEREP